MTDRLTAIAAELRALKLKAASLRNEARRLTPKASRPAKAGKRKARTAEEYEAFIPDHDFPFCWYCCSGRQLERAHIVNKPRREDVRAIVILCATCHSRSHGHRIVGAMHIPQLKVEHLLALKIRYDKPRYDRKFLATCCVGALPEPVAPPEYARVKGGLHDQ